MKSTTSNSEIIHLFCKRKGVLSRLILISFVITLSLSCRQGGRYTEEQDTGNEETTFKPNPVKIPRQDVVTLKIGETAPDFNLPDISGKFYTLSSFNQYELLVIVFTCNHCPTAQAYEQRLIEFTKDYSNKSVGVIAIMPNSSYGLLLEECGYSDLNDSYAEMKIRAEDKSFNFPYLYDGDDQSVSVNYGPTTTPHVFVFDSERYLRYTGHIDASEKPGTANAEDLRMAVDELLAGKPVTNAATKAFGCSIKWSWKSDWTDKVNREWDEQPVNLEWIDNDGMRDLLANDGQKLRLINFWATWCTPCVTEFSELVKTHRMYRNREFELITISLDYPENKDKAHAFLKKKYAALQNYIYAEKDKYEMIELVDSLWGGALPYTLLIEPGGDLVFREQGIVDIIGLRKIIVEHPLLGRYY
jgi:peroxiredoxin